MMYRVAIVGATGNVGREMLDILHERNFPIKEIVALASSRSVGRSVSFGDQEIKVQNLDQFDFSNIDLVFSSPGAKVSQSFAPKAAKAGAIVIDNTSFFRMHDGVPLVVPEVNAQALDILRQSNSKKIIANPNCSTIQMLVALAPIHQVASIKRIVVATYQSVSGSGKSAMDELFNQTRSVYVNDTLEKTVFTKQIAFNCIPHVDHFMDDGSTKEEWKMVVETHKILDPNIKVSATCVRIPVFIGHGEAVNIELEKPLSVTEARAVLNKAEGISVFDRREDEGYVTPKESAGEDNVFVSRIRPDKTLKNGLSMWIVADNLRKGAALNSVQIGEALIARKII
ncbi:MAG: aspartate-semialdehyde dehydrogenase [Pseudomonadota bacterium]